MSYTNEIVRDLGNHVKVGPNTKGTGTRGTVMPDLGKTQLAAPVADPKTLKVVGKNVKALRGLKKHSLKSKV